MKNNIPYLTLFIACTLLWGCKITEYPYTSITEDELSNNNPQTIEALTLGNYSMLKHAHFVKGYHYVGEYCSDNISLSGTTTDRLMFVYNFQRFLGNYRLDDQWALIYRIIVNCNNLITIASEGQSSEQDHLIGENYFIRGFLYYQLARTYSRSYHLAVSSDLGTPLKLTSDKNDYPPRATVQEQYAQIIKDLQKAESLMSSSKIEKSPIYGNVWAVKALLSRVYLTMHDYVKAARYATDVIDNSSKTLISRSAYSTMNELVPERNPEALFAIRLVKDMDISDNGWDAVGSMYAKIDNVGYGEFYASEPLRDLLSQYPSDVRMSFIEPQYITATKTDPPYEFIFDSRNYLANDNGDPDPMIQGLYRQYYRFGPVKQEGGNWTFQRQYDKSNPSKIVKYAFETIANHELSAQDTVVHLEAGRYYINVRQVRVTVAGQKIYGPWFKAFGKIQPQMEYRNDYPKYFITKCSYQEKQTHLWSPMILRLSEMYLNRAESRCQQGDVDGAISDMNVIKTRAGIPPYDPANDGIDLLTAVLDERRREFYLEGQRFFDLMRNDKPLMRNYPGGHDRGAPSAVKLIVRNTDNFAIQYIPQREIDTYPIPLPQNPD